MENIPLVRTKLIVPEIPEGTLFCDRIKNLNLTSYRAVFVVAPAGYGKTTAVLLSLRNQQKHTHWYRVEKEDFSLPIFYSHLIQTLFGTDENASIESLRSLASIGHISEEYPLINAVICQDAWSKFSDADERINLVFDDFHNVAGNSAITETIRYFISNMPPNISIFILSRTSTGIRTERLQMIENVSFVDEDDLRFDADEIEKLIDILDKPELSKDKAKNLFDVSEGWIAGINMMLQAPNAEFSWIKPYDKSYRQNVFDYLMQEAFEGLDRESVRNMARISLLSDFSSESLADIFEIPSPLDLIAWFEKNNLYIQKIGATPAVYRFHSLFNSALRTALEAELTFAEIEALHIKAAEYYLVHDNFKESIVHLLYANCTDMAVKVAEREGQRFMDNGDIDSAAVLLQAIPKQYVEDSPTLLMILGATLVNTETDQSYIILQRAIAGAVKKRDIVLAIKTQGLMISVCTQRNDYKSIKEIISYVPPVRAFMSGKNARKMLVMSLFTKAVVTDKIKLARILKKRVMAMGVKGDLWEYANNMSNGTLSYTCGDLKSVFKVTDSITNHKIALINDRWRSLGLSVCIHLSVLSMDTDSSSKLIEELAAMGEKYDSDYCKAFSYFFSAFLNYQNRNLLNAVKELENAENVYRRYKNIVMMSVSKVIRFMWMAEAGSDTFLPEVEKELDTLDALAANHGFLELGQIAVASLMTKAGDYTIAEKLFTKAYTSVKDKLMDQSACGAASRLADFYYQTENIQKEYEFLRIFAENAKSGGYVYFREMNYTALTRVCARCIELGLQSGHMRYILSRHFGSKYAAIPAEEASKIAVNPKAVMHDTAKPANVNVHSVQVTLFGSFRLIVDGDEISPSVWKTRKISGIIKYILSKPFESIPREVLAAALWPESDSKAASTSLRVALYELRKTLSRLCMAFNSENALISEQKDGFRLCDRPAFIVDTDIFNALYESIKAKNLTHEETKRIYRKMVDLYKGDFLAHDTIDDWTELLRERYRSIFSEVAYKLFDIYLTDGEMDAAEGVALRLMEIDPLDDKACSALVNLYDNTGRTHQAASLRKQFEKRFLADMGVKPSL